MLFRSGGDGEIFLLGDEITANIDPQNAENIYRLLQEEFANSTIILVAHGDCGLVWNKRITVEGGQVTVEEAQREKVQGQVAAEENEKVAREESEGLAMEEAQTGSGRRNAG